MPDQFAKLFLTQPLSQILAALILVAACGGEKEFLAPQIQGIRTSIQRILINPLAFDSAIVALEGIVKDIEEGALDDEVPRTKFKLTDLSGNFITVSMPTSWVVEENDFVVVGGIYRRTQEEVEAQRIEVIVLEEELEAE
jgi:hypothetical protein